MCVVLVTELDDGDRSLLPAQFPGYQSAECRYSHSHVISPSVCLKSVNALGNAYLN